MAEQLTFEYEEIDGVKYYVKDATARTDIGTLNSTVGAKSDLPDSTKSVTKNIGTVNTSVTTLNNNLSNFVADGFLPKNLFDKTNVTLNQKYIADGLTTTDANWATSLIKVKPNTKYTITSSVAGAYFCEFNASKTFIKQYSKTSQTITTSSNCEYLGVSIVTNTSLANCDINTFQIEEGASASAYTPYCPPNTEITSVKKSLSTFEDLGYLPENLCPTFRQGSLTDTTSTTVIVSVANGKYVHKGDVIEYACNNGYLANIGIMSANTDSGGTVLQSTSWANSAKVTVTSDGYIRFGVKNSSSSAITPSANHGTKAYSNAESNSTIKTALSPSAYISSGLTYTNCSYVAGGYIKIGNLVVINMRVSTSSASPKISGFPSYSKVASTNMVTLTPFNVDTLVVSGGGYIDRYGVMELRNMSTSGAYIISATYLCD